VKWGEVWTVAGGPDYAGKPRPALILQDEFFDSTDSVTICPATTTDIGPVTFRVPVAAAPLNGLKRGCFLMADKVTTVPRRKLGERLGLLGDDEMLRLTRAVATFLRLAG
jgi:mRNA interferase MazF